MVVIQDIVSALWQHDFAALADPHVVSVVYFVMFATLFLENGLLPASFLPGDSLLLLAGALIAQDVMSFLPTIAILTAAASLGCWLSYLQGRWLGNTRVVKSWLAQLPHKYHQRATCMFDRHGLLALLVGVLAAVMITRQITGPLRETLVAVEKIASGDLTQHARITRRDELGVLQRMVG